MPLLTLAEFELTLQVDLKRQETMMIAQSKTRWIDVGDDVTNRQLFHLMRAAEVWVPRDQEVCTLRVVNDWSKYVQMYAEALPDPISRHFNVYDYGATPSDASPSREAVRELWQRRIERLNKSLDAVMDDPSTRGRSFHVLEHGRGFPEPEGRHQFVSFPAIERLKPTLGQRVEAIAEKLEANLTCWHEPWFAASVSEAEKLSVGTPAAQFAQKLRELCGVEQPEDVEVHNRELWGAAYRLGHAAADMHFYNA